jgi:FkbM family methyltransferase
MSRDHKTGDIGTEFTRKLLRRLGRDIRGAGNRILDYKGARGVWIDVGAHSGNVTFHHAQNNPSLLVYAFEPNWKLAAKMMGKLANFVVLPMAVSDQDGLAEFFVNSMDAASSLLPMDDAGLKGWAGGESLRVESAIVVHTIRLDTFIESMDIKDVDYLKIDTQGADLKVVQSLGSRISDIRRITLEADLKSIRLYKGSASKDEIVKYLEGSGFNLSGVETQTLGQEENLTFDRMADGTSMTKDQGLDAKAHSIPKQVLRKRA